MPRLATRPAPSLKSSWTVSVDDHVVRLAWCRVTGVLAAAAVSGPVTLFDREGRHLVTLAGHRFGTSSISWSADGRYLATGGQDGRARVWDALRGDMVAECEAGAPWVECVAFSPTDDLLATGAGRKLRLWNSRGELRLEYPDHPSTIVDIQWQSNAPYFATAAYGQLAIFSTTSEKPPKRFKWKGSILTIAWSPDGNYAATGNQDATVHFWYRKSGKDLEMSGYPSKIRELSWDATSRFLATGGSASPVIWDCSGKGPAGTKPIQLDAHQDLLTALAYQHAGPLLASGARDGMVYLWQPRRAEKPLGSFAAGCAVTNVCWSPDDTRLVASTADGHVVALAPPVV